MRRRIVTLAALTLSLSAIGIAPLTAQATSSTITAILADSVDVTIPATLTLSSTLSDAGVSNVPYTLGVTFNGGGYKVTFTSAHQSSGAFQMTDGSSHFIPYTIVGNSTGDSASYASSTQGTNTLTVAAPSFNFSIAPFTLSPSTTPAGTYTDSLTVLVTAV